MKRVICGIVLIAFVGSQITGCATTQEASGTAKGAGIGAVGGAVIGAIIGGRRGAAIGALAGAAVGAVTGHYYDQQNATRAQAEKKYGPQIAGDRLEIESATLAPEDVAGGAAVDSAVQYTTLSSRKDAQIKVTEVRTLIGPKDTIELAKREVARPQGTYTSTMKFTFPKDLPKGDYTLVTTITDGIQTKTARSPLRVV
jgi:hypothetical protein